VAKKKAPPIHPGEVLLEEYLKPLGISQYRLAKDTSVPPRRINEIVHGKRAITADTALRLARYFGTSERFWLNLQTRGRRSRNTLLTAPTDPLSVGRRLSRRSRCDAHCFSHFPSPF
jgi:addiction module HigA family antidote